jgi:excisionase family DNA binding protein
MARWEKRLAACQYAKISKTKIDRLIAEGRIRAKKDDGGRNAPVFIDLDSIDEYYDSLKPARGVPRRHNQATTEAA